MVKTVSFSSATKGYCDVRDITGEVADAILDSGLSDGIVTVFVPGSTAGVTTIEYEPGAIEDLGALMERWIPSNASYRHNERWKDGNGFSHLRAACMGPSLTVPFKGRKLMLGTWQQIVVADFDNRDRLRTIVLQMLGE